MVAPGIANVVLVQHLVFGDVCGPYLSISVATRKAFVLGRTLRLRLQGYQTCVGAGMVAPGLPNAMLVKHFVLIGMVDVGRLVGW